MTGMNHKAGNVGYVSSVSSQREAAPPPAARGAPAATLPAASLPAGALSAALARLPRGRWVLAVSGGRDSMALLHAMAETRAGEIALVATFDHGTGAAARDACALVMGEATARGLDVTMEVMSPGEGRGEERWRAARWRFLTRCAHAHGAAVVTAHTRDDQMETVVMRLLRNAGPRGLAGMAAFTSAQGGSHDAATGGLDRPAIVRPLLHVSRGAVEAYVRAHHVPFVDDPSNANLLFQRNRVRHELLPALERASPGFGDWCLDIAARASAWRQAVDDLAAQLCGGGDGTPLSSSAGVVVLDAGAVASLREAEWQVLWPALAARAGITMDRRGLVRASTWAPRAAVGAHIPLSGDARIERTASTFVIRRGTR